MRGGFETSSAPETAFAPERENLLDDGFNTQTRGVEQMRVWRGLERRDLSGGIPQITLRDLPRKGGKTTSGPLADQLLMTPLGAFFGAGGEENLQLGTRKDDRAHIPPVGDQSGGLGEGSLAAGQGRSDRR